MQKIPLVLTALALLVGLTGCGSTPTTADRLQTAITHYNDANPTTLSATGTACRQALSDLGNPPTPGTPVTNGSAAAVNRAYTLARQAFSDCVTGAQTGSYPLMAQADQEIAAANAAIAQAERLSH